MFPIKVYAVMLLESNGKFHTIYYTLENVM